MYVDIKMFVRARNIHELIWNNYSHYIEIALLENTKMRSLALHMHINT